MGISVKKYCCLCVIWGGCKRPNIGVRFWVAGHKRLGSTVLDHYHHSTWPSCVELDTTTQQAEITNK